MSNASPPDIDVAPDAFETEHNDLLAVEKQNYDKAGNLLGELATSLAVKHPTAEYGNLVAAPIEK